MKISETPVIFRQRGGKVIVIFPDLLGSQSNDDTVCLAAEREVIEGQPVLRYFDTTQKEVRNRTQALSYELLGYQGQYKPIYGPKGEEMIELAELVKSVIGRIRLSHTFNPAHHKARKAQVEMVKQVEGGQE